MTASRGALFCSNSSKNNSPLDTNSAGKNGCHVSLPAVVRVRVSENRRQICVHNFNPPGSFTLMAYYPSLAETDGIVSHALNPHNNFPMKDSPLSGAVAILTAAAFFGVAGRWRRGCFSLNISPLALTAMRALFAGVIAALLLWSRRDSRSRREKRG